MPSSLMCNLTEDTESKYPGPYMYVYHSTNMTSSVLMLSMLILSTRALISSMQKKSFMKKGVSLMILGAAGMSGGAGTC